MAGKAGGLLVCALVAVLLAAGSSAARHHRSDHAAIALNILPPGESGSGGVHAVDQEHLYNALTPLRGNITAKTLRKDFKPETLAPPAREARADPAQGVRILRDSWGVAHVYGKTSADTEWGAGWVTAEDRLLILQLIRGPTGRGSTGHRTTSPARSSRAPRPRTRSPPRSTLAAGWARRGRSSATSTPTPLGSTPT
jgi:hypothetical protein